MNSKQTKQLEQNTQDISEIKSSIDTIKNNHLHHIEKDMSSMDKRIEKMDNRIWWVLGLLVAGLLIPAIKGFM